MRIWSIIVYMWKLRKLLKFVVNESDNGSHFRDSGFKISELPTRLMTETKFFSKCEDQYSYNKKHRIISDLIAYAIKEGYLKHPQSVFSYTDESSVINTEEGRRILNCFYWIESVLRQFSSTKSILIAFIFSAGFWIFSREIIEWVMNLFRK